MFFRVRGLTVQGGRSTLHNPEQVTGSFIWKRGVAPLSIILNKCLAASSGDVCSSTSVSCMHRPKGASLPAPRCSEGKCSVRPGGGALELSIILKKSLAPSSGVRGLPQSAQSREPCAQPSGWSCTSPWPPPPFARQTSSSCRPDAESGLADTRRRCPSRQKASSSTTF